MHTSIAIVTACLASTHALADIPRIDDGGMVHVTLSFDGALLSVDPPHELVTLTAYEGETYDGAASVLNGTAYSSRYGILHDGFLSLGAGQHLWIERTGATAGLNAYSGGMRMMAAMHAYDPIFQSDGDRIEYLGAMTHPWFATTVLGAHEMSFRVFIGDEFGVRDEGIGEDTFTLSFNAVPAPGAAGVLGLGALLAARRRR
ncbi:MAG: hypothetical protein ACF8Q5_12190 [Phycisphaerales bacterium JB040]